VFVQGPAPANTAQVHLHHRRLLYRATLIRYLQPLHAGQIIHPVPARPERSRLSVRKMKRLVNSFVQGLLLVAPIALTIYVCYVVFRAIDGMLRIGIPGVGFLLTLALITLVGSVASNFVSRRAVGAMDRVFDRLPFVRLLYSSIKDLLNAFVGERRRFDKPVVVYFTTEREAGVLGFLTQESLEQLGMPGFVAVYLPQSYNFAGNLIVVPTQQVERLQAESAAVMAFIVSGGVTDTRTAPRPA
jgi:uncharacterized membrane protein